MKILCLLLLAISCSSQAPKENAPMKSPYSAQKCLCMKIFDPVCSNGRNFGNSCEAECQGFTQWTQGQCLESTSPKKNK